MSDVFFGSSIKMVEFSFQVKAQEVLDQVRLSEEMKRERLCQVARTALRTKVHSDLADKLTEVCVDAVLAIKQESEALDLHMVEIVEMQVREQLLLSL